jgi:hypothetical protein
MPVPSGPQPINTITSPALTGFSLKPLTAAMAARSLVNTRAGPVLR